MHARDQDVEPKFNQDRLIKHVNRYFAKFNRPLWKGGKCHGLVIVWLQKMALYLEQDFYQIIKRIIDQPAAAVGTFDDDIAFQKFVAQVSFAQWPATYLYKPLIEYKDIDKILESESQQHVCKNFNRKTLAALIGTASPQNNSFVICSSGSRAHSLGVFFRNNQFYVFDPNYNSGKPTIFTNATAVVDELMARFYDFFKCKPPIWPTLEVISTKLAAVDRSTLITNNTTTFFQPLQRITTEHIEVETLQAATSNLQNKEITCS